MVSADAALIVRAPMHISLSTIEQLLRKKIAWIRKAMARVEARPKIESNPLLIEAYKKEAKEKITERVELFAKKFGLTFRKVKINSARRRWGSCSTTGNLNFSWRLVRTPLFVIDYVVIHELAHLEHKNHSPDFWKSVQAMYPDTKMARRWLKENC